MKGSLSVCLVGAALLWTGAGCAPSKPSNESQPATVEDADDQQGSATKPQSPPNSGSDTR